MAFRECDDELGWDEEESVEEASMAKDFDHGPSKFEKDDAFDFELTPEQEAELKRAIQDCNDGLTYTMLVDEDGKLTRDIRCNKCQREGGMLQRPFPHKFGCPMGRL